MDRTEEIKKIAVEWGEAIGRDKALVALIKSGFSTSAAEKILSGRYPNELRADKASKLTSILAKSGFTPASVNAS